MRNTIVFILALFLSASAHAQTLGPPTTLSGGINNIGIATGTSLALGGCTIGTDTFCVTGTSTINGLSSSGNGAASISSALFNGTIFSGGTGTTTFPQIFIQPAGTAASTAWNTSGTIIGTNVISGFAGNFLDFHVAGAASVFKVDSTGAITSSTITSGTVSAVATGGSGLVAGAGGQIRWNSSTKASAPADGGLLIQNTAGTDFGLLQFGGTTASFPALKRSTTGLLVRLADDSANAPLTASTATFSGLTNTATTSAVCYNTGTGALTYDGTLGTCTVSDERKKNMGESIPNALEKLLAINGVYYTWKDQSLGAGQQIGIGAQTVERVFPELVQTDSNGLKSVDYQRLTAPIIEALREIKLGTDKLRACSSSWKCRLFGVYP